MKKCYDVNRINTLQVNLPCCCGRCNMLKKVLFSTFLFFMFGFNICCAEQPLEFRENEDCHIIRLEQKGIGPHKFIHTGMNDNPFILEAIGSFLDYRALALTDIKGKTNELIDIEGHAFEITEYYAWYNKENIKFGLYEAINYLNIRVI